MNNDKAQEIRVFGDLKRNRLAARLLKADENYAKEILYNDDSSSNNVPKKDHKQLVMANAARVLAAINN